MIRLTMRVLLGVLALAVVAVLGGVGAYYSGLSLPVSSATTALKLDNWNQTQRFNASVTHKARVRRTSDRVHATVRLNLPEAIRLTQSFLDGGRELIVTCGPQKLFMHRLMDAQLSIQDQVLMLNGMADLELDGLIKAKDDLPLGAGILFGHDAKNVWIELKSLQVATLPNPMTEALVRDIARVSFTREQILAFAAKDLSAELADLLATHRDAVDLRFEEITPRIENDVLKIEVELSFAEGGLLGAVTDHFVSVADEAVETFAKLIGPNEARADFFKQVKKLGKVLEDSGQDLGRQLRDSDDPAAAIASLVSSLGSVKQRSD